METGLERERGAGISGIVPRLSPHISHGRFDRLSRDGSILSSNILMDSAVRRNLTLVECAVPGKGFLIRSQSIMSVGLAVSCWPRKVLGYSGRISCSRNLLKRLRFSAVMNLDMSIQNLRTLSTNITSGLHVGSGGSPSVLKYVALVPGSKHPLWVVRPT